jgi:hypothetical protein
LPISRKHFVAATALGISSVALKPTASPAAQASPLHLHILTPGEYGYARMLGTLGVNKHNKQVFSIGQPTDGSRYGEPVSARAEFTDRAESRHEAALADFMGNVLTGFQVVPAGVAATQLALERGWHSYPVI